MNIGTLQKSHEQTGKQVFATARQKVLTAVENNGNIKGHLMLSAYLFIFIPYSDSTGESTRCPLKIC